MKNQPYILNNQPSYVYCSNFVLPEFLKMFRDSPAEFKPDQLVGYFDRGYKIFQKRLEAFSGLERELTPEEERELKFMMDSLIDAKNTIYFFKRVEKN
jgi:hypothetical protein